MSKLYKKICKDTEFQLSQLVLEVSISCYGRWMNRDKNTIELNQKSLAYRAILEEYLEPIITKDHCIVIRGQSLPSSSYTCKYTCIQFLLFSIF